MMASSGKMRWIVVNNIVYLLLGIVIGSTLAPAIGEVLRTFVEMKRKAMLTKAIDELVAQATSLPPTKDSGILYRGRHLSDAG